VQEIDVVQRDLTGLQNDVDRFGLVELSGIEFLVKRHIVALDGIVGTQGTRRMRAPDHPQAPVLRRRVVEREPSRARGERPDRPVLAVLMPRRALAAGGRLGEEAGIPQGNVGSDQLRRHVQDLGVVAVIQETGIEVDQRRTVVAKPRLPLEQRRMARADRIERRVGHPEVRNNVAVAVVAGNLVGSEQGGLRNLRAIDAESNAVPGDTCGGSPTHVLPLTRTVPFKNDEVQACMICLFATR
jgi:hypothetical protein